MNSENTNSIGVIIQARLGSTRLPNKILLPFYKGQNILDILISKLKSIDNAKIILATTDLDRDDELVNFANKHQILCYRGSEQDVLNRFIAAAEHYDINKIIRVCSDNPFLDTDGLKDLISNAIKSNCDYMGYTINGLPSIKTHFGFWAEYVTLDALKKVDFMPYEKSVHEHVTIAVYGNPQKFKCQWITCPDFLQGRNDIRLTIDTIEDFINAQKIYSELKDKYSSISLENIVQYLDAHPEIKQSMKSIITQNSK